MAITKVTFTAAAVGAPNCTEVYNFLEEYAADYFVSMSLGHVNQSISCVTGGTTALFLSFDAAEKQSIQLSNAQKVANADYTGTYGSKVIRYGYATPYGIMLVDTANEIIIVTKSNEDTTAIIAMLTPGSSDPAYGLYFGDIENDSVWYKPKSNGTDAAALRALHMIDGAASLTTLMPVVLGNGGTYAPHVFIASYSENGSITTPKKLTVAGKDYIYDGLFALEA